MSAINLTIDGKEVEVAPGTTILEAARQLGIDIPTFCHDPELAPNGACRICVVEVEKARALVACCVAPAGPGMVVHTESERVIKARRSVLSLMLANHPLDCITCEKTGACRLQDYCYRYGVSTSEFTGEMKELPFDDSNLFFVRDMNKCILCGICVGKCQDVVGAGAIDFTRRGFVTNVGPSFEDSIEESSCVFCGMCIDNCPVGALIPKYSLNKGRPWQVNRVPAVCPYCSLGCAMDLHAKDGVIIGVSPSPDSPVNRGQLCARGKFGWDHLNSNDRITTPLIKSDGVFVNVSWDEAFDYIVDNIEAVQARHGARSLMGLGSPKAGNEENYLFQKLIRSLGSNNVDSYTRHCHAPSVDGMMRAFGNAATTNSIEELSQTGVVLVVGADPAENHPILEYRVREAVQKGASLVVASAEPIALDNVAHHHLAPAPGTDVALVNGLAQVIIAENLYDSEFVAERSEGLASLKETLAAYTPERVEELTGVSGDDLRTAARIYAGADKAAIVSSSNDGYGGDLVLALANLAILTGNVGREGAGLYFPYGENNLQGSADMGVLPNVLTAYQSLADDAVRQRFSEAWGVTLSAEPGISAAEVFTSDGDTGIRAMLIMGENPASCGPEQAKVAAVLEDLDFLVVQDIFMTETAALADVVLPGAAFAEKTATYTNTERRVQVSTLAVDPPGEVYPEWAVLSELAHCLGLPWDYDSPEEVFEEITSLTPSYAGLSYGRLANGGLQWPCPGEDHPGTAFLHTPESAQAPFNLTAVEYRPVEEGAICCCLPHQNCGCLSDTLGNRSVVSALKKGCCCD